MSATLQALSKSWTWLARWRVGKEFFYRFRSQFSRPSRQRIELCNLYYCGQSESRCRTRYSAVRALPTEEAWWLLVCCWADGSGWWAGENRSLGPSCMAAGSKFRFFSDSVSLVWMRKSTGGLAEVITNGLASSPHDWLKVENKSKVQPRWLLKCWFFSLH